MNVISSHLLEAKLTGAEIPISDTESQLKILRYHCKNNLGGEVIL